MWIRNMFKRMACGGYMWHLHGHDNQVTICRPCNDQKIFELECALEAALKTIVAIDERQADEKARVEIVAAECHKQWSGWIEWMFSKMTMDEGRHLGRYYVDRWQRQANTHYADLSEDEKESDRIEARKILAALRGTR